MRCVPRDEVRGRTDLQPPEAVESECRTSAGGGRRERLADGHAQERGAEPDDEWHGAEPAVRARIGVACQGHGRTRVEQCPRGWQSVAQHDRRRGKQRRHRLARRERSDAVRIELFEVVHCRCPEPRTELGGPRECQLVGVEAHSQPGRGGRVRDALGVGEVVEASVHEDVDEGGEPLGGNRGDHRFRDEPGVRRVGRALGDGVRSEEGGHDPHRQPVGNAPEDAQVPQLLVECQPVAGLGLDGGRSGVEGGAEPSSDELHEGVVVGGSGLPGRAADTPAVVRPSFQTGCGLVGAVAGEDRVGMTVHEARRDERVAQVDSVVVRRVGGGADPADHAVFHPQSPRRPTAGDKAAAAGEEHGAEGSARGSTLAAMAAKPAIVAVDDDAPVLRSIERDLRARYGGDYRVVTAGSGADAIELVAELTRRGDPVALFVVDQRMPVMTGIELLRDSLPLQPEAKRVLLTAYADTEVAIRAINEIRLDQYLLKPWNPPEERLYPVLDDLLADWTATFRPAVEGLRLLSGRWAPRGHAVRDFLTRNQVPYAWLDPTGDDDGRRLAESLEGAVDPAVPVVLLADGRVLRDPSNRELADAIGLSTRASLPFYDLVIVGAGPAGLAAAVYGSSEGLKTLLIEREAPGGQAGTTSRIENYLGFPSGLTGSDLARRALAQARRLGTEILSSQEVATLRRADPYRTIVLDDGAELSCQAVVIATGVAYRQLEIPGAAELSGRGVYYGAATTEAMLYREGAVGVIGSGNSAGQAAVHLARYAGSVHLFARGASIDESMSAYLVDQIGSMANVEVHVRTEAVEVSGHEHLENVTLRGPDGPFELPLSAVFVFIGQQPRTAWLEGVTARDDRGFLLTGPHDVGAAQGWPLDRDPYLLESSMPGVFAAGDVRGRSVKRIASAVGEGSTAVQLVHQYLATL